jgi:hypothetical protein
MPIVFVARQSGASFDDSSSTVLGIMDYGYENQTHFEQITGKLWFPWIEIPLLWNVRVFIFSLYIHFFE